MSKAGKDAPVVMYRPRERYEVRDDQLIVVHIDASVTSTKKPDEIKARREKNKARRKKRHGRKHGR